MARGSRTPVTKVSPIDRSSDPAPIQTSAPARPAIAPSASRPANDAAVVNAMTPSRTPSRAGSSLLVTARREVSVTTLAGSLAGSLVAGVRAGVMARDEVEDVVRTSASGSGSGRVARDASLSDLDFEDPSLMFVST